MYTPRLNLKQITLFKLGIGMFWAVLCRIKLQFTGEFLTASDMSAVDRVICGTQKRGFHYSYLEPSFHLPFCLKMILCI